MNTVLKSSNMNIGMCTNIVFSMLIDRVMQKQHYLLYTILKTVQTGNHHGRNTVHNSHRQPDQDHNSAYPCASTLANLLWQLTT
jgi:hypothetical protein